MTWLKVDINQIAADNAAAGNYFFERSTLRFFNDTRGNWDAFRIGDRVFIRNARHKGGRGMFARCTLRGQVREVSADGGISAPIAEFDGMTARQIARHLAETRAAADSINAGENR